MRSAKRILKFILYIIGSVFLFFIALIMLTMLPFLLMIWGLMVLWNEVCIQDETEAEKNQRLKDEWRGVF